MVDGARTTNETVTSNSKMQDPGYAALATCSAAITPASRSLSLVGQTLDELIYVSIHNHHNVAVR